MKFLLIIGTMIIFSNCSLMKKESTRIVKIPIKSKYIPLSVRLDTCIKDYLKLDLNPNNALNICKEINNKQ